MGTYPKEGDSVAKAAVIPHKPERGKEQMFRLRSGPWPIS